LKPKNKNINECKLSRDIECAIDYHLLFAEGNITYRELALELENEGYDLSYGTVWAYCQALGVKMHNSHIKPKLTEFNKCRHFIGAFMKSTHQI
jgi:hypothetical protein